jgi:hypothetical protein
MIDMKVQGDKEVAQKISMMKRIIPNEAIKGLFDVALEIRNNAIISMQNTVRRGDRVYKRGTISHRPSAPGWPPAIDTGNFVNSLVPEILPDQNSVRVGSIITGPPYPFFLEEGTVKMDERTWMEPAIEATKDDIEDGVMNQIIGGIQRL